MQADHRRWALLFLRWMATARNRFIAELVLWFVGVWWLGALLIAWAEIGHSTRIQNLQDAFYGVLVTMTTSGDSAVAPVTAAGRWIMAAAVLASKLLTALLCALAAAVLIERKVREDLGLKMFEYKDHVIVVELLDPAQGPVLQAAGATDIVGIGEVGGYLLAEAAVGDEAARTFIRELSERGRRLDESAPSTRGSVLDRF